jgi:formyltetrahydrofolate deformylase
MPELEVRPAPRAASSAQLAAGDPAASTEEARLIVFGQDRIGIVAAVSAVLAGVGANIVSLDQHSTDPTGGLFFQRTVFRLAELELARPELEAAFDREIRDRLQLEWRLARASRRKRVAVFASKSDHCLLDLLWRQRRGELEMNVEMVISNHPDHAEAVRQFGIPYFHVPVKKGNKPAAEGQHLSLLQGNVDLVVLARYMQIISGDFIRDVGVPVINIHHSFLPAFIGAGPYQKAKERGVKLIGATAHYVTEELDAGPIIEQDVVRVTHVDSAQELERRGADVERQVLARAVGWHCEDRVMRQGNTTVVFAP